MAKGYSYVIVRDYGFAPNPFWGVLTLATCKPRIRKSAQIGDFVIGHSPKGDGYKIIFIMKVSSIMTFDEYWNNEDYSIKRPVMNGSLVRKYGDNIYHHGASGNWIQEDSHHSLENGSVNLDNLHRDTGMTDKVLLARDFIYLGKSRIDFPDQFTHCICNHRGYKLINEADSQFLWNYLEAKFPQKGLIGDPIRFHAFSRYDGKS